MPDTESLTRFFLHLNAAGYGLAPQQLTAAHHLLFVAHTEAWSSRRWQRALRGVFAKTEAQQQDFDRRFALWSGRADHALASASPATLPPRSTRLAKWLIAAGVLLICALVFADIVLNAPPQPPPPPPPLSVPGEAAPQPAVPEAAAPAGRNMFPAAIAGVPIVVYVAWLLMRWRRRSLWMSRGPALGLDDLELPDHDPATEGIFSQPTLERIAWTLRVPRPQSGLELDVGRTVTATAAQAGAFTPVWRDLTERAQYLFLLEEDGTHDHLARLFDQVIDSLSASGVAIERYYFHGDPRFLLADDHARSPTWLPALADRRAWFPLVVIGAAQQFADPLSGAMDRRISEALDLFGQRILLSTKAVETWSTGELMLLERGFSLGTASTRGLIALADHVIGDPEHRGALLDGVSLGRGDDPAQR